MLPLGGIYLAGELDLVSLGDMSNLLIISGAFVAVDLVLLYVARRHSKEKRYSRNGNSGGPGGI